MHRLSSYSNLATGGLALALALTGSWQIGAGSLWLGGALFGVALVVALFAFRQAKGLTTDGLTLWQPTRAEVAVRQGRGWLWLMLLLPLLVGGWSIYLLDPLHPTTQFWLLHLASLALFGLIVGLLQRASRGTIDTPAPRPWKGGERMMALGILLIALFMRVYLLPDYPFGVWFDEASTAEMALRMLNEEAFRPVFLSAIYGPAHYVYLTATLFAGIGPSIFALRLVSVILGVLSVPAGFFAGKEFFGRRGGAGGCFFDGCGPLECGFQPDWDVQYQPTLL